MEEASRLDDLGELLRRCHRDELEDLARVVRVNPRGMGLRDLTAQVDRMLRRRGRHELLNVLHGGEGPAYHRVLESLARRAGVEPAAGVEDTETRLLEWAVSRQYEEAGEEERAALWHRLGMEGYPPAEPGTAMKLARTALGRGFAYGLALSVAGNLVRVAMLVPLLGHATGCLTLFLLGRPRDDVVLPAVMEVARLRQVVRHRVTVGVVGSPSSGKDAAIRALFGLEGGVVDPVAGSTRVVEITRLPGATALFVVNTPGLGDVVEEVTEEARQVLDHVDVYLYLVNAQGGVQVRELADWSRCLASGRPALAVVNKIDTLRPEDRERYLRDARAKLRAPERDFLAAAFDPLPQLSEEPMGVGEIRRWLTERLVELGKDPGELPWEAPTAGRS